MNVSMATSDKVLTAREPSKPQQQKITTVFFSIFCIDWQIDTRINVIPVFMVTSEIAYSMISAEKKITISRHTFVTILCAYVRHSRSYEFCCVQRKLEIEICSVFISMRQRDGRPNVASVAECGRRTQFIYDILPSIRHLFRPNQLLNPNWVNAHSPPKYSIHCSRHDYYLYLTSQPCDPGECPTDMENVLDEND